MMEIVDTLLVSYNPSNGDENEVLIVGRKPKGREANIVNAFQGEEAVELYKKLTTVRGKNE